ncbi:MAG: hypothetical protein WAK55_25205 [Xanthobacteraceae bacterium]
MPAGKVGSCAKHLIDAALAESGRGCAELPCYLLNVFSRSGHLFMKLTRCGFDSVGNAAELVGASRFLLLCNIARLRFHQVRDCTCLLLCFLGG